MKKETAENNQLLCRKAHGFTLIELLIVMTILGVLVSLSVINYNAWQKKAAIERQTNELLTDINTARLTAIHTKQRQGVVLNPDSYVLKNYSSDNEGIFAGTVQRTTDVKYPLVPGSGGSYSGNHYLFDSRGLLYNSTGTTITVSPAGTGANDCIVLSVGRTNMGKMSNGCVF